MTIAAEPAASRARRLRNASHEAHERVDAAVMAAAPFASRHRYAGFLRFQHRLHRRVEALYADAALAAHLPGLAARSRLAALEQDFADLGLDLPPAAEAVALPLPEALGWLYVVEGSNMGAALLAREAAGLGLDEGFGARHLAGHAEGRGLHWRRFTAALDAVALSAEEEARAEAAARAAFAHVLELVRLELAGEELGG